MIFARERKGDEPEDVEELDAIASESALVADSAAMSERAKVSDTMQTEREPSVPCFVLTSVSFHRTT